MEKRSTFSILFYIKKNKSNPNSEAPIYMRVTLNGRSSVLSLHRKVPQNLWDAHSGTVLGNTKIARAINSYILSVRSSIYEHYKYLRETKTIVKPVDIKNAFLGIEEKGETILELFQQHNDDLRKLINIDYAPDTVQRYVTSLKHTREFIKYKFDKDDYYITDIDTKFILDFEMYLKTERNCTSNTAVKYVKNFQKIVRIALSYGLISKDPFANIKLKIKKTDRGFLTEEELLKLINTDIEIKRLEEIRDCFIFSCFTGLAYSDLKKLTRDDIVTGTDGGKWIKTYRKKTNTLSKIPILDIPQKLIDKYSDNPYCNIKNVLLPVRSNQKMNSYLKEIEVICNINKRLSTHLARHTFATTVTLNNGIPIETVSKMLGHTNITTTRIYARLLDKRVGEDMRKLKSIYTN